MEISKYFKTPSLKYFMKFLIFIIKWLKTFKNMIKVSLYEVSRKYIMLFMHNNRYLPLTGLLTLLQWTIQPAPTVHRETFEIFQKYFTKYFMKYFTPKNSWNFTSLVTAVFMLVCSVVSCRADEFAKRKKLSKKQRFIVKGALATMQCLTCTVVAICDHTKIQLTNWNHVNRAMHGVQSAVLLS